MLEFHLLKHCLVPARYSEWSSVVQASSFSPPAKEVWLILGHWHSAASTPATEADLLTLAEATPGWDETRVAELKLGLKQVGFLKADLPAEVVIRSWLEREVAASVAAAADRYIDSPETFEGGLLPAIMPDVEKLQRATGAKNTADDMEVDMSMDFDNVLEQLSAAGELKWRLKCLDVSIGPLYPGMFVVIGGRPESGKTTLLASELSHMLLQLPENGVVAFFNNEQSNAAVKFRIHQALLGAPSQKIKKYPTKATNKLRELMGTRRVMVMDVHNQSIIDVERRLASLGDRVGLIVFDQASKLSGLESVASNDADRLQKLAARLKALASTCAPVMTTVWADGSAEGEMWVDQNQLYGSKTGIPGEAEVIINVGHSKAPEDEGLRFLNIPKNKSMTCQDERRRHSHWTVLLKHEIARVEDPPQ